MKTLTIEQGGQEPQPLVNTAWNSDIPEGVRFTKGEQLPISYGILDSQQIFLKIIKNGEHFPLSYLHKKNYITTSQFKKILEGTMEFSMSKESFFLRGRGKDRVKLNNYLCDISLKIQNKDKYIDISATYFDDKDYGPVHIFNKDELPEILYIQLSSQKGRTPPRYVEIYAEQLQKIL